MAEHTTETLTLPEKGALDTVNVFWQNFRVGQGSVTITCWGSAWTAYFGGMGGNSIQEFFRTASVGYLVNKLGCTQWLKQSKKHDAYLARIISAVQFALQDPREPNA